MKTNELLDLVKPEIDAAPMETLSAEMINAVSGGASWVKAGPIIVIFTKAPTQPQ